MDQNMRYVRSKRLETIMNRPVARCTAMNQRNPFNTLCKNPIVWVNDQDNLSNISTRAKPCAAPSGDRMFANLLPLLRDFAPRTRAATSGDNDGGDQKNERFAQKGGVMHIRRLVCGRLLEGKDSFAHSIDAVAPLQPDNVPFT